MGETVSEEEEEKDKATATDDEESSLSEDDFLKRFAARKSGGKDHNTTGTNVAQENDEIPDPKGVDPKSASYEDVGKGTMDDESSIQEISENVGCSIGKKVQKRAQQKEIVAKKKAEKASVEELVRGCKKAQRVAKEGEVRGREEPSVEEICATKPSKKPGGRRGRKAAAEGSGSDGADPKMTCAVCAEEFPSRTQLFSHIRSSGHAVIKEVPQPAKQTRSQKKKK